MAGIQEVFELVDRFTAPFTRFISLSEKAAGSASAVQKAAEAAGNADLSRLSAGMGAASESAQEAASAMRQASQAAETAKTFSAASFSGKGEQVQAYVQELLSVQQNLQRANIELNVHQRMLASVSAAQGDASSEAAELAGELSDLAAETMSLKDRQSALRAALEQAAGGGRKADAAIRQYERAANSAASSTSGLVDQVKRLCQFAGIGFSE